MNPFESARLGPIALRNRFIKSATFEGMAPEGLVSDRLVEFHRRVAAGGAGMTTVAYCSVSPDGRTYRDQIWMRPEARDGLRGLTDAVHHQGAAAAIQLGHAGFFASPRATGAKPMSPSRTFAPNGLTFSRPMEADDFDRLLDDYAAATRLAVEAGFDAVEVHLGHGYLLSQFLSPWSNRRTDEWGGDIERRARFPRRVLDVVRRVAGAGRAVTAKLNMLDGFRGGLTLDDGIEVARLLEADGTVDALELTGGFTSRNPMFLMRGETPLGDLIARERSALRRLGLRVAGRRIMRAYPFEEAFFLPQARAVRAAVSIPLILLGGITKMETVAGALEDGFEFVAMARALLREPDLVHRFRARTANAATCVPCNRCVVEMESGGTRCVFNEPWEPGDA
ncbi:MAG: NADH:flavin oxidoreductase [Actinobacteria bacterium]|nr:NADH:flavin oxidoreductase [Actinomycetota bacterium]